MSEVINHLWQSTVFAAFVAIAALALKSNRAGTRYWLWLAASFKFLIPFTLLMSIGTRVDVLPETTTMPALTVEQMTTSFAPVPLHASALEAGRSWWPLAFVIVWLVGATFLLFRWFLRWRHIRLAVRATHRLPIDAAIPVLSSQTAIEPGVFGVFRPVLLLPEGITSNLSAAELDAILAHEISHVRRRDNLTSALHMCVEALFWFHPLVWWIGQKLVDERERACDEAVLDEGNEPQVYAQSILNVCKHYVESPLACASGVSGADLRKRIVEILCRPTSHRLTLTRKVMLSVALIVVVSVPLAIGILRAQVLPPPPNTSLKWHQYVQVIILRGTSESDPDRKEVFAPRTRQR
jgi:bla regulator protein blaR1